MSDIDGTVRIIMGEKLCCGDADWCRDFLDGDRTMSRVIGRGGSCFLRCEGWESLWKDDGEDDWGCLEGLMSMRERLTGDEELILSMLIRATPSVPAETDLNS